ncbi:hypothetical protein GCM10022255_085070 [Dactylosporangium darangshiense]|uniref:Uncharacterized protein n=1 Tax=Dactylosporangium darangshiense TaxID=579108 RepID=A0ABP8DME2_9ACTN
MPKPSVEARFCQANRSCSPAPRTPWWCSGTARVSRPTRKPLKTRPAARATARFTPGIHSSGIVTSQPRFSTAVTMRVWRRQTAAERYQRGAATSGPPLRRITARVMNGKNAAPNSMVSGTVRAVIAVWNSMAAAIQSTWSRIHSTQCGRKSTSPSSQAVSRSTSAPVASCRPNSARPVSRTGTATSGHRRGVVTKRAVPRKTNPAPEKKRETLEPTARAACTPCRPAVPAKRATCAAWGDRPTSASRA